MIHAGRPWVTDVWEELIQALATYTIGTQVPVKIPSAMRFFTENTILRLRICRQSGKTFLPE